MKALEFYGTEDVRVVERPRPMILHPQDVIVRITLTTICGSDLHMYHNLVPRMEKRDVLGHEFMGIIDEVGPEVRNFKRGDRVVASAVISCGNCVFCQRGEFSLCENTNPSKEIEELYGARTSGIFGYSHLTGGYDGGQAEFARVPIADVNLIRVPDGMRDEQVLFLSDIVCTGWHGNELAEVRQGDTVAVWGCGPVGLMAQAWARFRGASRVIGIDCNPHRLDVARRIGSEVIDFSVTGDVVAALKQLIPGGPDCCIDCVGFRFPKTFTRKLEHTILEKDSTDVVNEVIRGVRKGGRVALIGDYFGWGNNYPVGPQMEKGITVRGSQVYVQKYWKQLLRHIEKGEFDPTFVITHKVPLANAAEAYRMFDRHEDNCLKILLVP